MARKNKETQLTYDTEAMKRKDQTTVICIYNAAVDCNLRDMGDAWFCNRCGWNPSEAERRKIANEMFRVTDA